MNTPNGLYLSFEEIFGSQEEVSLNRLETVLEKVVEKTFEHEPGSPNEFVHVVTPDGIRWMTVAEAEAHIKQHEKEKSQSLQRSIQQALRGSSKILAQEHKILFALANHTLKRYREGELIPLEEVQRAEPNITRLGRTVCTLLDKLQEIEIRIKQTREKHPVLKEFEKKVGELLSCQKEGNQQKATLLAQELAKMKNKYIYASRGLSSDNNQSLGLRRDLQGQKKSILSWQRYLAAQREGTLQTIMQNDRSMVEKLEVVMAKTSLDEQLKYKELLEQKQSSLQSGKKELDVVQREQVILEQKERETENVIQHLEKEMQQKTQAPEKPAADEPPPETKSKKEPEPQTKEETTSKKRMASVDRHGSKRE